MSSSVIQILKTNIGLTSVELESRIRGVFQRNNCHGTLQKENIRITGRPMVIRRLFIQTNDSGEYSNVGWVVNEDLNNCMICAQEFTVFLTKQHCYGCGNLVCSVCSNEEGIIYELEDMGPLRVCNQCFWGQEPVYARYTRIEDSMLEDATRRWASGDTSPAPSPSHASTITPPPPQLPLPATTTSLHKDKSTASSYLSQSTSDDEDEDENMRPPVLMHQRTDSSKMLIRKSTDEPVTHVPMFARSRPPPSNNSNEVQEINVSKVPFQKRDSGGNTTTLVELFPFKGDTEEDGADHDHGHDHDLGDSNNQDDSEASSSPPPQITQLVSSPSSGWNASAIFAALLGPKTDEKEVNTPPSTTNQTETNAVSATPVVSSTPAATATMTSNQHSPEPLLSPKIHSNDVTPRHVLPQSNVNTAQSSVFVAHSTTTATATTTTAPNPAPIITNTPAKRPDSPISKVKTIPTDNTSAVSNSSTTTSASTTNSSSSSSSVTPPIQSMARTRIPSFEDSSHSPSPPSPSTPNDTSNNTSQQQVNTTFRTLPTITPTPFTVLKTKRYSNNTKVFVNVLTLPDAYFDTSTSVLFHTSHQTEDKGGESCDVFDICCSDQIINLSDSYEITERCVAIIDKINEERSENLDVDYKTPKIKGNYKGGEPIKSFQSQKQVSISQIQKDPKLCYLFTENSNSSSSSSGVASSGASAAVAASSNAMDRPLSSSSSHRPLSPPPPIMKGWMKKQGHQFKTIKRRYFVLQEGELKYYEKSLPTAPFGEKLKGMFPIKDGSVELGAGDGKPLGKDGTQRLFIQALGNDMKIECEDELEAAKWMQAMQQHIDYYGTRKSGHTSGAAAMQRTNSR